MSQIALPYMPARRDGSKSYRRHDLQGCDVQASCCQTSEEVRAPERDSDEQRVVYKSSPTQRAPSEPPEAGPSLSGRQISADEDTLRQRLISAVQRPSGSDTAGQLAETLSLRSVL